MKTIQAALTAFAVCLAILLPANLASATTKPPAGAAVVAVYKGHVTNSFNYPVQRFTIPAGDTWEVKWSYSSHGTDTGLGFGWEIDRSANINNIPCNQVLFCLPDTTAPAASGTQTMNKAGTGHFYFAVVPASTWEVQVIDFAPHVIYSQHGSGPGDTAKFNVPATSPYWQVDWSYNCHPSGSTSIFDFTVDTPTGQDTNDYITPNQLGWGYSAANRYYDHGTFFLAVNTDPGCVWSIQVVA